MANTFRRSVIIMVAAGLLTGAALVPASAAPGGFDRPPPINEPMPQPPHRGWHWVPGYWHWSAHRWVWARGHYVAFAAPPMPPERVEAVGVAPMPHMHWIRGHWIFFSHDWHWQPGHWIR